MNFERDRKFLKDQIVGKILRGVSAVDFESMAVAICQFQYKYNALYREYCSIIGRDVLKISSIHEIPFLPIQFFKNYTIKTGNWASQSIFSSSGTTGAITSQHHVRDLAFYTQITRQGFAQYYGDVSDYCVIGLLPSYLERQGSSLVVMVDDFIQESKYKQSGFFLNEYEKLFDILLKNKKERIPTLLIGVSFGLLDFVERYTLDFPELIVMETGGMKCRRKEMIREELHEDIKNGFQVPHIHSEYGMTELFSQGYSTKEGIFKPISTMGVFGRDINDPLSILHHYGRLVALNVIDFGNLDTCCFIATDDLGRVYEDNSFVVLGRLDNSDIRGCNLMVMDNLK